MELKQKKSNFGLIMAVYLLGIFMGAIDTGILTPARTIIQNNLGVDDKTGIWMITIYTLAYAASIPIMGKLADKFGRKIIYLTSILLFGLGSLFCGLSSNFNSFELLLAARAIQALGGGGIVPVATAEFGTTFPKEKRGMALGLVGGVYGIANIFGASAGSAIIDLFGANQWQIIFYVNLPITVFIVIAGLLVLPNNRGEQSAPIDFAGISVLTVMVLSLMYGLKNIDFFDIAVTLKSLNVYPFLIAFVLLLPVFILVENKAADPIINLSYFKNLRIVITLILTLLTGIVMMGMIFVPQFAENTLKIKAGSGGYFVLILGLFAGVGAPFSGKLIDKLGVKIVMGTGLIISVIGSLFLIFVTIPYPSMGTVIACLVLIGLGIGFTMGTPLNYMMLDNTRPEESNSALATLSLIRSIGTAIAPAIMVGFIAHAGLSVQANVMAELPTQINVPKLPYTQELTDTFGSLKSNPATKAMFASITVPDLTKFQTIDVSMGGTSGATLSPKLVNLMKSSDVTTIVDNSKVLAESLFAEKTPEILKGIDQGLSGGLSGLSTGITQLTELTQSPMIPAEGKAAILAVQGQLEVATLQMTELKAAVPDAFTQAQVDYVQKIEDRRLTIEKVFQDTLNVGFKQVYLTVTLSSLFGILILLLYRNPKRKGTI